MILNLPSGKYRLYVTHIHDPGTTDRHGRYHKVATSAWLKRESGEQVGEQATAFCSADDQFRKKVGVRLAVTRLIKDFPRHERALIWARVWNLKK